MLSLLLTTVFGAVPFETMVRGNLGDADKAALAVYCEHISRAATVVAASSTDDIVTFPGYFDSELNERIGRVLAASKRVPSLSFSLTTKNGISLDNLLGSANKEIGCLYIAAYRIAQLGLASNAQSVAHRALAEFSKNQNPNTFATMIGDSGASETQIGHILSIVLNQEQVVAFACQQVVQKLKERLDSTLSSLKTKAEETGRLERRIGEQEVAANGQLRSIDDLNATKVGLEQVVANLRRENQERQDTIVKLTTEAESFQKEMKRVKAAGRKLESEHKEASESLIRAQAGLAARDAAQTDLKRRLEAEIAVVMRVDLEKEHDLKLSDELALQADRYEGRLRDMNSELESLRARRVELERGDQAGSMLADRVSELQGRLDTAQKDYVELTQSLGQAEGAADVLQADRDRLDAQVAQQRRMIMMGSTLLGALMSSGQDSVRLTDIQPLAMCLMAPPLPAAASGVSPASSSSGAAAYGVDRR